MKLFKQNRSLLVKRETIQFDLNQLNDTEKLLNQKIVINTKTLPAIFNIYVTLQHTAVIYGADSQRKFGIPLLVIKGGPSQKEKRLRLNDD